MTPKTIDKPVQVKEAKAAARKMLYTKGSEAVVSKGDSGRFVSIHKTVADHEVSARVHTQQESRVHNFCFGQTAELDDSQPFEDLTVLAVPCDIFGSFKMKSKHATAKRQSSSTLQKHTTEQEVWAQKTVPELIGLLGQFETDRRSANIAAAIIENTALPETKEYEVRQRLCSFIEGTISSRVLADQIALRCALRKFIFLQDPGDFRGIQWLLNTLPNDPADNRLEAIKTLADFLRFAPPTGTVDAPELTGFLAERCEKFFDVDLFAYSEVRVIAFQSLLALALLASPDTERFIAKARAVSEGTGKALARRAQDMLNSLSRRRVGSEETHRLLRAMLISEDERRARLAR